MATDETEKLTIGRRRLLQAGGAGLIVATAGCRDILGGEDSDVPGYASYIPVTESDENGNEGAAVAYLDIAALEELPESDQSGDGGSSDDLPEDPLLAFPLSGVIAVAFIGAFTLGPLGFGGIFEDEGTDDSSSPVEEILFTGAGIVVTGEFDTDSLGEELTTENEDSFQPAVEQVDERDEYTIYANPDSTQEEPTRYAVGSEEIVVGTESELETTLDVILGDAEPAHETFEEFAWLLSEGGDGTMATGAYAPEGALSEDDDQEGSGPGSDLEVLDNLESATGIAGSLSFDEDGQSGTARLALSYEEISDETRSELEDAIGAAADDVSLDFDDGRMTAEGSYSEEQLQSSDGQDSES